MTVGGTALPETHALLRVLAAGRDVLDLGSALMPGRPVDRDPVRGFLLRDPRLVAAELRVTEEASAIVAVRR